MPRVLPELQASGSEGRLGVRHVDPSCGRPKDFERLLEILNDFADWLGLRASVGALANPGTVSKSREGLVTRPIAEVSTPLRHE